MTDNSDNPNRPNAKYRLSKEKPDPIQEEELNFYYNRERRLEKAPANVRALYNTPKHKFNLLRPLIADRPRATLFFTIVGFCIVILILSLISNIGKSHILDGNKLIIKATVIEDVSLIEINKKTIKDREPYTGEVNIGISPVTNVEEDEYAVFTQKIFFTLNDDEFYSFTVPFNDPMLILLLETEKTSLKVIIKPK